MKKRNSVIFMIIIAVCLLCGCQKGKGEEIQILDVIGNFDFTILKAGQADAIFMQTEKCNIVLDCGETNDGDELVELLKSKGISNLDYIFITHFDKDHIGGFPELMENVTANNIIVPNYEGSNTEYVEYLNVIAEKNLKITVLDKNTVFTIDDVVFEVSVPKRQTYAEGDNDFSLVISATHGENTFLFAGDAEKDRLTEVISEFGRPHDFLKVPHHGKYNKNTKRFVTTVKPLYSVICDSQKNPAEDETISVLEYTGSKIFSTKDGDVMVSSDGKEIKISQQIQKN